LGLALGIERDLAKGQTLADFEQPGLGDHVHRAGPAQEVAGQVGGDRELDPAQHAQDRHIDRIVGQAHEQRPGHRAARTHKLRPVGQANPAAAVADLLHLDAHFDRPRQLPFRHLMHIVQRDFRHRSTPASGCDMLWVKDTKQYKN
jgi:hypothetical protein